jgi:hypothetical protein
LNESVSAGTRDTGDYENKGFIKQKSVMRKGCLKNEFLTPFLISDILKERSMNKEFLIQLTNNLYRLTLLFPKKEPLRYKMREVADDILAKPNEKDLEVLDSFFEVVLVQNWVSSSDILAIKKEYDNLRETLKKYKPEKEKKKDNLAVGEEDKSSSSPFAAARVVEAYLKETPIPLRQNLDRREKILEFLKEKGRAQVWQIKQVLPEVTKRTLRRDFEHMLEQGLIERMGEKNDTFYQIRNIQS